MLMSQPPVGPWERRRVADLRVALVGRGLDPQQLDALLELAGDPLPHAHKKAGSGDGRKRAAPSQAESGEGEERTGEKRPRTGAAPDPHLPEEVVAMSVTELRVRGSPRARRFAAEPAAKNAATLCPPPAKALTDRRSAAARS